jgi:hypothetical protein
MGRETRINVEFRATMIAADGHATAVVIRDVSARGFRIEHSDDLIAGDTVMLRIDKGEELKACIQWCLGREAGGIFLG